MSPNEDLGDSQQLPWLARGLLGLSGIGLATASVWALLVNGKEGAMPTTMIILGALMLLISLVGFLPDRLWAGDSGIQFTRRMVRREMRAAAEVVMDDTPPERREAVVERLVEDVQLPRDEAAVELLSALRASVEAAQRRRYRAQMDQLSSTERSLELAWSDELLTASQRARRMEQELRAWLARVIPEVEAQTHKQLIISESPPSGVDLEVAWVPNSRILVEAKLTTRSLTIPPSIRRNAREAGQHLGLLVLVGGGQSVSSLTGMQARLSNDIDGPVLVRRFEDLGSNLVGDLVELVHAVDRTG